MFHSLSARSVSLFFRSVSVCAETYENVRKYNEIQECNLRKKRAINALSLLDWMREVGVYDEVTEYSMTASKEGGLRNQAL